MEYARRWAEPQAPAPAVAHHPHGAPQTAAAHHLYSAPPTPGPSASSHLYEAPPAHHHLNLRPALPSSSAPSYYYYPSASVPNPNPSPNPGTEAYTPNPYVPHGDYEGFRASSHAYQQAAAAAAAGVGCSGGLASYYCVGAPQGLALKEAIRQYGADPSYGSVVGRSSNGLEPIALSHAKPAYQNSTSRNPSTKNARKKVLKGGIDQHAYCEVCKIDCTSQEVLRNHKLGKKHKKNLQKLQESITPRPPKTPTTKHQKEVPAVDEGKAVGEKTRKRIAPATPEELEAKKQRVLEGGATAEGVRVCTICNVVVNSQQVFDYHLAGQKHATMVRKQQAMQQATPVNQVGVDSR